MINVAEHIYLRIPDFESGATPLETARYFREKAELQQQMGDTEGARISQKKAKNALQLSTGSAARTLFILTPPGVGGFKKRGENTNYIGLHTVGTDFGREVGIHEGYHNQHENLWGKINVPGWDTMTSERKRIVFSSLGIHSSFGETAGIEALTQHATQKTIGETQSAYDAEIVPEGIRLFETLGQKSGKSTVGSFLNMALHGDSGGKKEFENGVRIGANIMLLEKALLGKVVNAENTAQSMSKIIESQKQNFVVKDMNHAQSLVESYLEVLPMLGGRDEELALAA